MADSDLQNLKTKVDAGADFITTQLFFDNAVYHHFVQRCSNAGIEIPVLPGLLTVLSIGQVRALFAPCVRRDCPQNWRIRSKNSAEEDQPAVGADWALGQVRDLLDKGAPGYHLYALNKSQSTLQILEGLRRK